MCAWLIFLLDLIDAYIVESVLRLNGWRPSVFTTRIEVLHVKITAIFFAMRIEVLLCEISTLGISRINFVSKQSLKCLETC